MESGCCTRCRLERILLQSGWLSVQARKCNWCIYAQSHENWLGVEGGVHVYAMYTKALKFFGKK